MDLLVSRWLALGALLVMVRGQVITPTNSTSTDGVPNGNKIGISMSVGENMVLVGPVLGLTSNARKAIPPTALSGPIFVTNSQTYSSLSSRLISLLLCDPYPGQISVGDVFGQAIRTNVSAIVLYSQHSDGCSLEGYTDSYPWIYSMKTRIETSKLLEQVNTPDPNRNGQVYAAIGTMDSVKGSHPVASGNNNGVSSIGGHNHQNQNENPLGPSPSTAVAMIILYSITGIITALFLVIIITGALRAHRHPERYGPRNGGVIGRARQSRARGLARAMLETLPIVKFGDNDPPKPADVELGDNPASREAATETMTTTVETPSENTQQETTEQPTRPRESVEGGIAAAMNSDQPVSQTGKPDNLGCSICTEDFEAGQDQRVLPCDHRFHPACIDPWLLNVSGTCPLCRIDLRPENARASDGGEGDENRDPILREGEFDSELAPPLDANDTEGDRQRLSIRRSLIVGIMGIGRPERLSREERVAALRRAAQQRRGEQGAVAETPEEESSRRARLRSLFGIRTRRTGQTEEQQPPPQPDREDDSAR